MACHQGLLGRWTSERMSGQMDWTTSLRRMGGCGRLGGWEGSGWLGEWRTGRLSAGLSGNEPVDVTETSVLLHSLWTCFTSPPWGDIQ